MSEAMTPNGVYDAHSDYQMRGALSDAELVSQLADEVIPNPARGTIVIADYGCAQGRVSSVLIHRVIEQLRAREPDVPVAVYHNDLLGNDWAALFDRLRDPQSYLHLPGGPITPLAAATSFYNPVTPPGIVDLGMSFAAAQWLSQPGPRGCGSALYFDQLDATARAAMAVQADRDWTLFLARRARELAPGARLIVNMMGVANGGMAAGHALWQHLRAICSDLAAEGELDGARLDDYVIPVYERTLDEVQRPFAGDIGEPLHLESLSLHEIPDPVAVRYRENGDAAAFAQDFTGFVRAWSEPSLREAFSASAATMADLYRRLESRLRESARSFTFEVHAVRAVIRRRD
jgi:hypothetical protein